jgi:hypothetical protein
VDPEATISGDARFEDNRALSFRDGIYRLQLPTLSASNEVLLHGVSILTDALKIARFFEENPLKTQPLQSSTYLTDPTA